MSSLVPKPADALLGLIALFHLPQAVLRVTHASSTGEFPPV
jgi:hypothetical protein